MLLCSVKIKKHTVTLISLLCAAVFVLLCFVSLRLSPAETVTVGEKTVSLSAEKEEDMEKFLTETGYQPSEINMKREIVIPSGWNELYTSYAELQKAQGFDLDKIKGKAAREYTYALQNSDLFAVITVCDNRIAAAHLSRLDGSGELTPLINKSRGGS